MLFTTHCRIGTISDVPIALYKRYSKTCVKRLLSKKTEIVFQDQLSLNADQKYCRMLQWEHSAVLSTFIEVPFVIRSLYCLFLSGHFRQVLL